MIASIFFIISASCMLLMIVILLERATTLGLLDIKVESELPGMGSQADSIDLIFAFEL